MKPLLEFVIPPKRGAAVEVKDQQRIRIIDLEGKQVVDTAIFNLNNLSEKLSTSFSRMRKLPDEKGQYRPSDRIMKGDILRSTLCRPLMTMVEETAAEKGVHDVHGRFCNRWLYEVVFSDPREGCAEILAKAVAEYGIKPEDLPDTIDLNMNYVHYPDEHRWEIQEPVSSAGDYVELRAEMDCLVAMSNCPEEYTPCNGYRCTPVKIEVYQAYQMNSN